MVSLSELDEERFGIRVARDSAVTDESLITALDFCRCNNVRLLITRCRTADLRTAQAIENAGGRLMDTLICYRHSLRDILVADSPRALTIRALRPEEAATIRTIAAQSFRGYLGHYHADPRLDRALCDETYADWAYRSCTSRSVANEVLVGEFDGTVVGFVTLQINDAAEAEVPLNGVLPNYQGRGVYRCMLSYALSWARTKGCERLVISTQVTNSVQKLWVRLGFEPSHSFYTFHSWFDT